MGVPTAWTRLIRFYSEEDRGRVLYGEPVGPAASDVGLAFAGGQLTARAIQGDPLAGGVVTDRVVKVKELLSPLPEAVVGTARCLGVNYEPLGQKPPLPILFYKPQTALSHPNSPIPIPAIAQDQSDYENELVVVIGKTCKNVSPAEALDHVLGYTLCNDVTARKNMVAGNQWGMGKAHDGWLPLGPAIVSAALIPDPQAVRLTTFVNGEKRQDESTGRMLWKVGEVISQLTLGMTLHPGTIICTGSPDGFGARFSPPKFLKDGDEVCCVGDHGLGTLINRVDFDKPRSLHSRL